MATNITSNAFLIVNTHVFPLNQDSINIGRNLDNHIVLQDSTISRVHAQVRQENNEYIIYDLNSTGGTYVNGKKITKSVLHSGDNVVLASVPILFVENTPKLAKRSQAETGPLENLGGEESPTTPDNLPKDQ